jgi:t-SNARE complex subunit (syntaxin)
MDKNATDITQQKYVRWISHDTVELKQGSWFRKTKNRPDIFIIIIIVIIIIINVLLY